MSKRRRFIGFFCLASTTLSAWSWLFAEEPAKRFLAVLREDGLTEIGLKYLELGEKRNRFTEDFKKDIPLERILLQQESLANLQRQSQQLYEARRAELEAGLKSFVSSNPDHPRRSEAQSMLADLLLTQARLSIEAAKKDPSKGQDELKRARASFGDAVQLFSQVIQELAPKITELRGERAKTAEQRELRDQYRLEYRKAQVLEAKSMQELGETFTKDSPEWKDWLGKAEKKLSELVDKTSEELGTRMLSLLYLGEVQTQLGKLVAAKDSLGRVESMGKDNAGVLREWKIQAVARLIRLDIAENPPKFSAAVKRGTDELESVKSRTSPERKLPHWIDLQLALCEARIAWNKTLDKNKDEGPYKANLREAREMLQDILKVKGPHQEVVRRYLAELGIDAKSSEPQEKLPEPKDFAEALDQARMRVSKGEDGNQALDILKQQNASADDIEGVVEQIRQARLQAIDRLQKALALYGDTDSREDLLEAKYLLAYLYYTTDQLWECAAVSESITRSDRGTDRAKTAGVLALSSMRRLIKNLDEQEQNRFLVPFEKLAKNLIANYPDSDSGKEAADDLVKVAIRNKRYDEAERFVALTGGSGGLGSCVLGQVLWHDFQVRMEELRKTKLEPTEADLSLRQRAERLLYDAWAGVDPTKADKNFVMGANALANIYLTTDRLAEAENVISGPERGALKLLTLATDSDAPTQLETYKLQLQALTLASSKPNGAPLDANQVTQIVGKMKQLAGEDGKLLTNALRNLAYTIQTRIETSASPDDQARIGKSLAVLVTQLVAVSEDIAVLDSAGNTANALATSLQNSPNLIPLSQELYLVADSAYSKIASRPPEELEASKKNPDELKRRMAIAKSGAGKYEEAHKLLVDSIQKSKTPNISLQVTAANNLQKWSQNKDVELLKKASSGTDLGPDGKNIVWGWGTIAAKISKAPNGMTTHQQAFLEAKYNNINCKRLIASSAADDATKKESAKSAADELRVFLLRNNNIDAEWAVKFKKLESDLAALPK